LPLKVFLETSKRIVLVFSGTPWSPNQWIKQDASTLMITPPHFLRAYFAKKKDGGQDQANILGKNLDIPLGV
jgi:hypothetical protein